MTNSKKQSSDYPWLAQYPDDTVWDIEIPVFPLHHCLNESVEKYAHNVALNFMGKEITYEQLGKLVDHAAKGLEQIGVGKGKKVGLFLPNCPQYVIMYYAILKVGATVVNFNPLLALKEIRGQVIDSGTSVIVTLDLKALFSRAQDLLTTTTLEQIILGRLQDFLPFPKNFLFPIIKHNEIFHGEMGRKIIPMRDILANDGIIIPPDINPKEDVALLQYTGGTTGTPKGAVLTHYNLYANMMQSCLWFNRMEEGKEILLAVLPFFHCFAMTAILNLGIQKGLKLVIHPRFNLENLLRDIKKEKITVLAAVPTIFSAINNIHQSQQYDFSSLKLCVSGGAPLPNEVKIAFETLAKCPLVEGYGLTEASPVVCVNPFKVKSGAARPVVAGPARISKKMELGSAGLPLPATVITIRDMEDISKVMPYGEVGEICVIGPQVMKAYYNKPEETAMVLKDGMLRTGDLGYLDENGFLYIVDRLKELIISGGYNVYPRNVEEALYQHPAIEEAAVIGKPDKHRGEIVVAYVKVKAGEQVTKEALKSFMKDHVSAYEMPKEFHFMDELPKTIIGKISKKDLKNRE